MNSEKNLLHIQNQIKLML